MTNPPQAAESVELLDLNMQLLDGQAQGGRGTVIRRSVTVTKERDRPMDAFWSLVICPGPFAEGQRAPPGPPRRHYTASPVNVVRSPGPPLPA